MKKESQDRRAREEIKGEELTIDVNNDLNELYRSRSSIRSLDPIGRVELRRLGVEENERRQDDRMEGEEGGRDSDLDVEWGGSIVGSLVIMETRVAEKEKKINHETGAGAVSWRSTSVSQTREKKTERVLTSSKLGSRRVEVLLRPGTGLEAKMRTLRELVRVEAALLEEDEAV